MKQALPNLKGLVVGLTAFVATFSPVLRAEDNDSDREMRTKNRQTYEVIVGDYYTGRSPYFRGKTGVAEPAPAVAPKAAPVIMAATPAPAAGRPGVPCSTPINTGLVQLSKNMPAEATLGEPFTYDLNAMASGCAMNVVVTDMLPEGTELVSTQPQASVSGNTLTWNLGNMDAGQSQPIKVTVKPTREGTLASCATIKADPRVCAQTVVGKPMLAIDKTGPEVAQLGADVSYTVVVKNTGTAVAKSVVVTDKYPAGLGGVGEKSYPVGDLAPGQSKTITVPLKAAERGRHCNLAVATASNTASVQDDACTLVVKPGLKLTKTGTQELFINKQATYTIVAENIGDTELTGVVVTDTPASPMRLISAPGASIAGNVATWNVGSMKSGEKKEFTATVTSPTAGRYCNVANITTSQGLRDTSEACTVWKGVSAVLLEVVDDPDPLQVGESTLYTIRITNQGNSDLIDINTVAQFAKEVTPTSSQGGTVDGKTVKFPTVARLAAKQSVTYTISAKAAEIGDHRLKVVLTESQLLAPVVEEESTRVY
jgi:uncharacterized repeat protein (TIGR01451 family)